MNNELGKFFEASENETTANTLTQVAKNLKTTEDFDELMAKVRAEQEKLYQENKDRICEKYGAPDCSRYTCWQVLKAEKEIALCEKCTGLPCKKGYKHFTPAIAFSQFCNDIYITQYVCKFKNKQNLQNKTAKLLKNSQVPLEYQNKTWDDYNVDENNRFAVNVAKKLLDSNKGAFFFGSPGTGKTLLVSIVAGELVRKGTQVIFCTVPTISSSLRSTYKNNSAFTESEILEKLYNVPVLILDDVGMEKITQFVCGFLLIIFNERYNRNLQTIITSNYTPDVLEYKFNNPVDGGETLDGSRIFDRWKKMCFPAELKGDSRR